MALVLSDRERQLYDELKRHSRGIESSHFLNSLFGWTAEEAMVALNRLSGTFVEFRTSGDSTIFVANPEEEVEILATLNREERLVYSIIKSSTDKGIWIKDIRARSNLATNTADNAVKRLETRGIIKAVKTVKHPTRKYYMLSRFEPSEEVVGGTWYAENELDTDFIMAVSKAVEGFIRGKSQPSTPLQSPNSSLYPTLDQISSYINASKISKVQLTQRDMQNVLDKLIYEGKIIKFYRISSMRIPGVAEEIQNNEWCYRIDPHDRLADIEVLNEVPCGKCPVIHLCCEDGVISPKTCVYYQKYLDKLVQ